MKFVATFFLAWIIFFAGVIYLSVNQYLLTEYGKIIAGPAFAIGIAPVILLQGMEESARHKILFSWIGGMICGAGLAIYLTLDLFQGAT